MESVVKRLYPSAPMLFLLMLALACACWAAPAHAQWINIGPDGASVRCLAIDPQDPQTLYAGANGEGVFKSIDGGTTWSQANFAVPADTRIVSLTIDPQTAGTLYVGTGNTDSGGGIFKSTDSGASWSRVDFNLVRAKTISLAIDPQNTQTIYAGTNGSQVFKSADGGANWNQVLPAAVDFARTSSVIIEICLPFLPSNTDSLSLAIDPQNTETIYAWTEGKCPGGVVFKSTNGGTEWSYANEGLPRSWGQGLAIDPQNPETIYAATGCAGVFKSMNGGTTWSAVNKGLPFSYVFALAIDPQTTQILYAGTNQGVFKSMNGGASWRQINSGLQENTDVFSLAVDPQDSETLYAGTAGAGVFKSTNGGGPSVSVPGVPKGVHARAGDGQATLSFKAPASDGGSPITSYAVYSSPGGFAGQGAESPIAVTGLTNGTAYTFTVRAFNAVGDGPASQESNRVTPKISPSIAVISPERGEIWHPGKTVTIGWRYKGDPGKTVRIELVKGNSATVIKESKRIGTYGDGVYDWTIPKEQAPGTRYKVRITSRTKPACTATSKGTFTIN